MFTCEIHFQDEERVICRRRARPGLIPDSPGQVGHLDQRQVGLGQGSLVGYPRICKETISSPVMRAH